MLKDLYDRCAFALIGAVFGGVLGAVLWFLYGAGFSSRYAAPVVHAGIRHWVLYAGATFAVLGFIFKAGAGSAAGGAIREVHDYEARSQWSNEVPWWLAAVVFIAVAAGVWYVTR